GKLVAPNLFYSIERTTMDRRDFLKTTSKVIAGATLATSTLAGDPPLPSDPKAEGRMVLPINRNWRFNKSYLEGAHNLDFDDSTFERVIVPHTNVRLPWHSFDDKTYELVSTSRRIALLALFHIATYPFTPLSFATPHSLLTPHPTPDVACFLQHLEASREPLMLEVELRDGEHVLAKSTQRIPPSEATAEPMAH